MPAKSTSAAPPVDLQKIVAAEIHIGIIGKTPLIVNRWSEKARGMMLKSQMQGTRTKKEARDPQADFEASIHRLDDGAHGFPATGFKAAIINAISLFDGLTKVSAKQAVRVEGEGYDQLVRLRHPLPPRMREDTVRNATGVADLRFRAEYSPWGAVVTVRYLPAIVSPSSILSLVDAAGFGGVGEWRPASKMSTTGTYGTFGAIEELFDDYDVTLKAVQSILEAMAGM